MPQCPALVTTVHDPEHRLLDHIRLGIEGLRAYAAVYAFVTEVTDVSVIEFLRKSNVKIQLGPVGIPGGGQRRALATAAGNGHDDYFVCDFDRWLHWQATWNDELVNLPETMRSRHDRAWYVCLGRTVRALNTHPDAQILPETATNRAISVVAGKHLDATAGAAWIRADGARIILDGSIETSKATDLEWPALILRHERSRLDGAFMEGLEFETADAYGLEIELAGSLDAWMRQSYDRPAILRQRLQLAADSVSALERVMGREGSGQHEACQTSSDQDRDRHSVRPR